MVNDEKIREVKAKAGRASGQARNKKRTQPEQNLNRQATALEYEDEDETVIVVEEPIIINSSERSNSNWNNKHVVQEVWSSIPEKRQRGRGKFQTAVIEHVVNDNVDVEKVKSALSSYYQSDEGMGKWWRTPTTLIEDIIWEEDASQWSSKRGEEEGFPLSLFDHERIVKKYRETSEQNEEHYLANHKKFKDKGLQENDITTRIAFKVWKKYPELRK